MKNFNGIAFLLCLLILLGIFSCIQRNHPNNIQINDIGKYRPQVHFSPEKNWMGVPAGFIYVDGLYHLFYEYNPDNSLWGNIQWGHAISNDLVHWTNLPIAIIPDSLGNVFSGCVVVDTNNTSNIAKSKNPPLIAFYMQYNQDNIGKLSFAYSIDYGHSWKKHKVNLVISDSLHLSDPKVFWHEKTHKWIMSLAAGRMINFYSSQDCIHWKYMSNFGQNKNTVNWKYPELFPLKTKGTNETKWVLLVNESGGKVGNAPVTKYFIGDFDGQSFVSTQSDAKKFGFLLDYGKDFYASFSCSNEPNNRRIIIAWMNCWQYAGQEPTKGWRGEMIFPRELNLVKDGFLYLIKAVPIDEISKLYGRSESISNFEVPISSKIIFNNLSFDKAPTEIKLVFDISKQDWIGSSLSYGIKIQNSSGEYYTIKYENDFMDFSIDRKIFPDNEFSKVFNFKYSLLYRAKGPEFEWRIILDRSSIEFFADDCKVSVTNSIYPSKPFETIELFSERSPIRVINCSIAELNSIWR